MERNVQKKIKSLTELADYYKKEYERAIKEVESLKKQAYSPNILQQYNKQKSKHPDAIILFRCGDFYETYFEDAVTASQVLGITLTRRNNTDGYYMTSFPHDALDEYIQKLIKAELRIVICDLNK